MNEPRRRLPAGEVVDINRRRQQRLERSLAATREELAHVEAKRVLATVRARQLQRRLVKATRELDALRGWLSGPGATAHEDAAQPFRPHVGNKRGRGWWSDGKS